MIARTGLQVSKTNKDPLVAAAQHRTFHQTGIHQSGTPWSTAMRAMRVKFQAQADLAFLGNHHKFLIYLFCLFLGIIHHTSLDFLGVEEPPQHQNIWGTRWFGAPVDFCPLAGLRVYQRAPRSGRGLQPRPLFCQEAAEEHRGRGLANGEIPDKMGIEMGKSSN